jgi:site-specific DNA-methyltransferase (adenine-specific)
VTVTIHTGDCRDVMATMDAESVDSIVVDPPYGIGFMGKAWDHGVPGVEFWIAALRVAKPGAYLLAFGGTRMFHRLACAIEDAGWELRDTVPYVHEGVTLEPVADCPWLLAWVYGSGFPKSKNLGDGRGTALKPAWEPIIMARKPLVGTVAENAHAFGTGVLNIDACRIVTDELLRAGAGAIPCRHYETKPRGRGGEASADARYTDVGGTNFAATPGPRGGDPAGRWPANLIHDGSVAVLSAFPTVSSGVPMGVKAGGQGNAFGLFAGGIPVTGYGDSGSAARFFYCAKASRADRNDGCDGLEEKPLLWSNGEQSPGTFQSESTKRAATNNHPTVKPTDLMRYCVRLVTPPGGTVLDFMCGSGSTGRGAVIEGFDFIGIEKEPDSAEIARCRVNAVQPGLSLSVSAEATS